ncbi:MAG: ABC transporter permease [Stackebrandtia sp.]
MRHILHAEWTKLRTTPTAGLLALATIATTVGLGAVVSGSVTCTPQYCDHDTVKLSLSGIPLSQTLVAALAVVCLGGEYGTGMIRSTIMATPRRARVLAAKAVIVSAVTLVSGLVAVPVSLLIGRIILSGKGFEALPLGGSATLRAAAGSIAYLILIGLFSLGAAALLRNSTAALGTIFGLLFVFPVLIVAVRDPDLARILFRASPMDAGLSVQVTEDLSKMPISPWAGLGILAIWTASALLAGTTTLHRRDA